MKSVVLSAMVTLLGLSQAGAWGATGHQIVTFVGSKVGNDSFWSANADGMRQLSTVPDRVWKGAQTKDAEAPMHWFQADAYVKDINQCADILGFPKSYDDAVSKYGEQTIVTNGEAPWRIAQMYRLAVKDFRAGDLKTAIEEAGAMSHYIGDLSQPLHVSENYDGKNTGNDGIHSWFETKNIGNETATRAEVLTRAEALMKDPAFLADFNGDLSDVLNREIIRSLQKRDEVLGNDTKYGRNTAQAKSIQLDLAEDRMADGAATLAIILTRLSEDAGLAQKVSSVTIEDPQWIAPDFGNNTHRMMFTPFIERNDADRPDDCDEL